MNLHACNHCQSGMQGKWHEHYQLTKGYTRFGFILQVAHTYLKQESSPPGPLDFQFNLYFKFYLLPLAKIHHALTLKPVPWYPGNICKILSITRIPGNHNVKRVSHSSLALPDTHLSIRDIMKMFYKPVHKIGKLQDKKT